MFIAVTRTKFRTTNPLDGVDIALGQSGIAAEAPITVSEMMRGTVAKIPNGVALRYKVGDTWLSVTYQQYYDHCISAAKSFIKVGSVCMKTNVYIPEHIFSVVGSEAFTCSGHHRVQCL